LKERKKRKKEVEKLLKERPLRAGKKFDKDWRRGRILGHSNPSIFRISRIKREKTRQRNSQENKEASKQASKQASQNLTQVCQSKIVFEVFQHRQDSQKSLFLYHHTSM